MKSKNNFWGRLSSAFIRLLTSILLFPLPCRKTFLFLEVSLSSLVVKTRADDRHPIDMVNFYKLVNNNYSEHVVNLPEYTLEVMWSNDLLDKKREFATGRHSLRDVLRNRDLMARNTYSIVDIVLGNLPYLMKVKLGLASDKTKNVVREEVVQYLNRKFVHQTA